MVYKLKILRLYGQLSTFYSTGCTVKSYDALKLMKGKVLNYSTSKINKDSSVNLKNKFIFDSKVLLKNFDKMV